MTIKEFFAQKKVQIGCYVVIGLGVAGLVIGGVTTDAGMAVISKIFSAIGGLLG